MVTRPDIRHTVAYARRSIAGMLVDSATVERNAPGPEPAPGYQPTPSWQVSATIPCRFPVPIPGSVLGYVPGADMDIVQRRYGMLVEQDADIREGDRVGPVIDLTGRQLNVRPMKVDAVVIRASHALVICEEYGVT